MSQYIDAFNTSTQIIVDNSISQVKFDETIVCTVLQTYADEPTKYYVSNGRINFYAYNSSNETYRVNSQVYVTIPKGDYAQEKIITGKYDTKQKVGEKVSLMENFIQVFEWVKGEDFSQALYNPTALGTLSLIKISFDLGGEGWTEEATTQNHALVIQFNDKNDQSIKQIAIPNSEFFGNFESFSQGYSPFYCPFRDIFTISL